MACPSIRSEEALQSLSAGRRKGSNCQVSAVSDLGEGCAVIQYKPIRLTGDFGLPRRMHAQGGANRHYERAHAVQADQPGQLRELLALHEAALASMSHGLSMVDADQRL